MVETLKMGVEKWPSRGVHETDVASSGRVGLAEVLRDAPTAPACHRRFLAAWRQLRTANCTFSEPLTSAW